MSRFRVNDLRDPGAAPAPPEPHPAGFHRSMPGYAPGPLVGLPGAARAAGVGALYVKDLSSCFGLPAFKIMGASWAVNRMVSERFGLPPAATFAELRERAEAARPLRLVTATDGNHGRAVAHMAALLGLDATIYVPAGTVPARIAAIRGEGARLEVVDGSYDDAVARAAADAGERAVIVSDTSWEGYTSIPSAVIDGYATLLDEVDEQLAALGAPPPDLVFAQCGVGAFPAAVGAHYRRAGRRGGAAAARAAAPGAAAAGAAAADAAAPRRDAGPVIVSVEPDDAACMLEAFAARRIVTVPGPHRSIMAGLNCGTLSLVAWPVLAATFDGAVTTSDEHAREAMRLLAAEGIVSGESGASGLAGLLALVADPELAEARDRCGVGVDASVLVFSTEGATDPEAYAAVVG